MSTHYALRLSPGDEIKSTLIEYVKRHDLSAVAVVTCVGSTSFATLRLAGASAAGKAAGVNGMLDVATSAEILTLVGTLGAGGAHLHITLGNDVGEVVGGHLMRAVVHTTAEIVLVALDGVRFERTMDAATGFKELSVVAVPPVASAAAPLPPGGLLPARDFVGYGGAPPLPRWPGDALLALNFVLNLEEGSEASFSDGHNVSEASLCECGSDAPPGVRDLCAEAMFEYGSRAGFWRVLREFEKRSMPATVMACAVALQRNPAQTAAVKKGMASGLLDICCHGYRWEDHIAMEEVHERGQIRKAVALLTDLLGERPVGWCVPFCEILRLRLPM